MGREALVEDIRAAGEAARRERGLGVKSLFVV